MSLLSKSLYRDGRECPKRAWLGIHHRDWAKAPTDSELARMKEGGEIGKVAAQMFEGVVDCRVKGTDEDNVERTKFLLQENGESTVFTEATFAANGFLVRVDLLLREPEGWRIIEVKSGSSAKPEYIEDVAFQWMVVEAAGYPVVGAEIKHINKEWRSGDEVQPFLKRTDVSAECRKILDKTRESAAKLVSSVQDSEPPAAILNIYCKDCSYLEKCQATLDLDDIIFLPTIRRDQVAKLRESGVHRIGEIPEDFKWNDRQLRVRQALETGGPVVDPSLTGWLEKIQYPAAFIDFETSMWSRPPWPGLRPYEQVQFQWSLHWVTEEGVEHFEYLATGEADPRHEFAALLYERMKDAASVIFYSSFEMQQIGLLAKSGAPKAEEMNRILTEKGVDLLKMVQECVYLHEFRGSFSIKSVLPALVPELSYKALQIQNGDMAVLAFKRLASEALTPDRVHEVRKDLLEYCKLDTLAMVRIYERLRELSGGPPASTL